MGILCSHEPSARSKQLSACDIVARTVCFSYGILNPMLFVKDYQCVYIYIYSLKLWFILPT